MRRNTKIIEKEGFLEEMKLVNSQDINGLVKARNVSKIYIAGEEKHRRPLYCVDGVNFFLKENEILGIIGPNGAGKTTLINILTRFCSKSEGSVYLGGEKMVKNGNFEFFRNCSICLQEDVFWDELSVNGHFELVAGILGLEREDIYVWLEHLNLLEFKNYRA